jgi:hypothetical protein
VKFQEETLEQEIKMDAILSDYENPQGDEDRKALLEQLTEAFRCWSKPL